MSNDSQTDDGILSFSDILARSSLSEHHQAEGTTFAIFIGTILTVAIILGSWAVFYYGWKNNTMNKGLLHAVIGSLFPGTATTRLEVEVTASPRSEDAIQPDGAPQRFALRNASVAHERQPNNTQTDTHEVQVVPRTNGNEPEMDNIRPIMSNGHPRERSMSDGPTIITRNGYTRSTKGDGQGRSHAWLHCDHEQY